MDSQGLPALARPPAQVQHAATGEETSTLGEGWRQTGTRVCTALAAHSTEPAGRRGIPRSTEKVTGRGETCSGGIPMSWTSDLSCPSSPTCPRSLARAGCSSGGCWAGPHGSTLSEPPAPPSTSPAPGSPLQAENPRGSRTPTGARVCNYRTQTSLVRVLIQTQRTVVSCETNQQRLLSLG